MQQKQLELTEEEAEAFVATLKQAGVRQHTTSENEGLTIEIYDTDHLHSELWRLGTDGRSKGRVALRLHHRNGRSDS